MNVSSTTIPKSKRVNNTGEVVVCGGRREAGEPMTFTDTHVAVVAIQHTSPSSSSSSWDFPNTRHSASLHFPLRGKLRGAHGPHDDESEVWEYMRRLERVREDEEARRATCERMLAWRRQRRRRRPRNPGGREHSPVAPRSAA